MQGIIGQPQAINTLQTILASGRWHHAYIFHGPAGVGKMTTALAFARILLCHARANNLAGELEACGSCDSCKALHKTGPESLSSLHPDLHLIRKELARTSSVTSIRDRKQMTIPVDLIRENMVGGITSDEKYHDGPAYRKSNLLHGKVFIVDEAELLNPAGQNAMLKTLEEPSPETYIILITSAEDRLLPTIKSRCQRVGFNLLDESAVKTWAHQNEQGQSLSDQQQDWLATFASGSIGRAKIALEYGLVDWYGMVRQGFAEMNRGKYPAELGDLFHESVNSFAEAWVKQHDNASKEAANRRATGYLLGLVMQQARLAIKANAASVQGHTPQDREQAEQKLHPWLNVFDAAGQCDSELAANVNMRIALEHFVANLWAGFQGQGLVTARG